MPSRVVQVTLIVPGVQSVSQLLLSAGNQIEHLTHVALARPKLIQPTTNSHRGSSHILINTTTLTRSISDRHLFLITCQPLHMIDLRAQNVL